MRISDCVCASVRVSSRSAGGAVGAVGVVDGDGAAMIGADNIACRAESDAHTTLVVAGAATTRSCGAVYDVAAAGDGVSCGRLHDSRHDC